MWVGFFCRLELHPAQDWSAASGVGAEPAAAATLAATALVAGAEQEGFRARAGVSWGDWLS